jgi:hypothetical protein
MTREDVSGMIKTAVVAAISETPVGQPDLLLSLQYLPMTRRHCHTRLLATKDWSSDCRRVEDPAKARETVQNLRAIAMS